jgi:hypothetical protein
MPKLISQKNLRKPIADGYVLSSSTVGVQSWVNNKSVGIDSGGSVVGTAQTINFYNRNSIVISSGVASVTSLSDPLTIIGL